MHINELEKEKKGMWSLTMWFEFDSAHKLPEHNGKCKNLHGHRYKVGVVFITEKIKVGGSQKGMACDFGIIKERVKELIEREYDHKFLNETLKIYPTAELIAQKMYGQIKALFKDMPYLWLNSVKVQETPNTEIEYYG